jgi:hypothetical protein
VYYAPTTLSAILRRKCHREGILHPVQRFRTRCFEHADGWFDRLVTSLKAFHEGFWLGCLSPDDLNTVTAKHFDQSRHYASTEHNVSGFAEWETPVLDHHFRGRSHILVAAAGAGREVLALRKAGFKADGFECSMPLVRASHAIFDQLGELEYVIPCAPDNVPPGPAIYDGLIVGWSAYTHIPTRLRRIVFLRALRERALPGSPLLVSFFIRSNGSRYETLVRRAASLSRLFLRGRQESLEPGDRLEWSRYVYRFTRDELDAELSLAGFRVVHYSEESAGSGHAVGIVE